MNAKEQAQKLYEDMLNSIEFLEGDEWHRSAKACALVAINTMLKTGDVAESWWLQVRDEVDKL